MAELTKYGVARHFYFVVPKRGVVDFAVGADWTPSSGGGGTGDCYVSIDGGAAAKVTNLPVAIAMGNTAIWDWSATAGELTGKQIVMTIADSATKAVEDQSLRIETFGHANAQHPFDLDTATQAVTVAAGGLNAASIAADTGLKIRSGTAQAGAASTITLDAGALATDSEYVGAVVVITGGTGASQHRVITGYVGSTKVATVGEAWQINPDNTSTFMLLPGRAFVSSVLAAAVTAIQSGLATSAALATVQADTDDIQTRLPAALQGGRMDSSIGAAPMVLTEPAVGVPPSFASTLAAHWGWWASLARNELDVNGSSIAVRNAADSGTIATFPVTDDNTTLTVGPPA